LGLPRRSPHRRNSRVVGGQSWTAAKARRDAPKREQESPPEK
jgi:hypothetical protein